MGWDGGDDTERMGRRGAGRGDEKEGTRGKKRNAFLATVGAAWGYLSFVFVGSSFYPL